MIHFLATYPYFTADLYTTAVWLLLFVLSGRQSRIKMLMLAPIGIAAVVGAVGIYETDWWHPTLLWAVHTPFETIGIEDIWFGSVYFGICATIGELFFRHEKTLPLLSLGRTFLALCVTCIKAVVILWFLFFVLDIHSALATSVMILTAAASIAWRRRDLLMPMIEAGLLTTLFALPGYFINMVFNPAWIPETWMHGANFTGVSLTGIPVEEFIWFFTVSAVAGVLWEYKRGIRFVNIP